MITFILASQSPRRKDLLTQLFLEIKPPFDQFHIITSEVDETLHKNENPLDYALRVAVEKSHAVLKKIQHSSDQKLKSNFETIFLTPQREKTSSGFRKNEIHFDKTDPLIILSADTIVVLGNEIFGKPKDTNDAQDMLKKLSGKTHQVITAYSIVKLFRDDMPGARFSGLGSRDFEFEPRVSSPESRAPSLEPREPSPEPQLHDYEITEVTFKPLTPKEILPYVASGEPMDKAGAYAIQGQAASFIQGVKGSYNNVVGLPTEKISRQLQDFL